MDYFPLFAQLKGRPILVVGGGVVALRKVRQLLKADAEIHLCARELNSELAQWVSEGQLQHQHTSFSPELLDDKWLVIAATDDPVVNAEVAEAAEERRVFINAVDDLDNSSMIFPSIVDRSPLVVAISSSGKAPVLARLMREKLEALLPQSLGALADLSGRCRDKVKKALPGLAARRRFWEDLFNQPSLGKELATATDPEGDLMNLAEQHRQQKFPGSVSLVGAGPGNPEFLTLAALQQIQQADVVVYDRLVSKDVLELVRRDADFISVGKQAGNHSLRQEGINALLVELAQQGKRVVRLKGADPFVFGRGGEELGELEEAGISAQVIPGLTAAIGCAASAQIPLTHRDLAQSAQFITGHYKAEGQEPDWKPLAQARHTLVIYMGMLQAGQIQQKLIQHGRAADTPVAIVERGTLPEQRVLTGKLEELETLSQGVVSPALMIIGEVASLARPTTTPVAQAQPFTELVNRA